MNKRIKPKKLYNKHIGWMEITMIVFAIILVATVCWFRFIDSEFMELTYAKQGVSKETLISDVNKLIRDKNTHNELALDAALNKYRVSDLILKFRSIKKIDNGYRMYAYDINNQLVTCELTKQVIDELEAAKEDDLLVIERGTLKVANYSTQEAIRMNLVMVVEKAELIKDVDIAYDREDLLSNSYQIHNINGTVTEEIDLDNKRFKLNNNGKLVAISLAEEDTSELKAGDRVIIKGELQKENKTYKLNKSRIIYISRD